MKSFELKITTKNNRQREICRHLEMICYVNLYLFAYEVNKEFSSKKNSFMKKYL